MCHRPFFTARTPTAGRLPDTTDMSAAKVAAASGYNMSDFNRQSLAEVGLSLTGYRNLEPDQKPGLRPLREDTKARL